MKTIVEEVSHEMEIKKSKFIAFLYKIDNLQDIKEKLEFVKRNCKDATHYCYAYILDNMEKASDDGEPSGTAGMPILNVLQKEQLQNVICIVVRYFGGIKLGSGGLIRAYSKACKEALKLVDIRILSKGYEISYCFDYKYHKQIDHLLQDVVIVDKSFEEKTIYHLKITEERFKEIESQLLFMGEITIIKEIVL